MATRVWLLDDNAQDRFLARRALTAEFPDLAANEIRDQAELDQALAHFDADVVVTDYQLRWTDGLKVLEQIRTVNGDVPVVMFTNTGNEEVAAAGLRAGLADYILKAPTNYARLAHAVRRALDDAARARREREAHAREREALRIAEEALRLKDEFLATLSHELRTPLNAISGWVQILKNNPDIDRQDRALSVIERNTVVLTRLIEDLVDVSRIITGNMALQIRPTNLQAVVDAALDAVRPAAQAKSLDLRVDVPASLPLAAADPERLQQIVWNLLSNAVKFTPAHGRISVTANASEGALEVVVSDNGPGIAPEFLPRVFDRFSQQHASFAREHGGLGLGLAIVRHLVDMHGGTVAVSSSLGSGATFTFRVPTAPAGRVDEQPSPISGALKELTGIRVLLVDDDADGRDAVAQMLEDAGAIVTAVGSAAQAYEALKYQAPDLLICDIGMPHEDGFTFIRRVRADSNAAISSVPAIALTAYARPQDRVRSIDAGFHSHIPKPFVAADLVALAASTARDANGTA